MEREIIKDSSLKLFVTTFYNNIESSEVANKMAYELNQLRDNLLEVMEEEKDQAVIEQKLRIAVQFLSEPSLAFLSDIDTAAYVNAINLFDELHREDREPVNITITSAVALTHEQRDRIIKAFRKKVENHHLYVKDVVDESVLGGVKLESDNYAFDNTLRTKLNGMKKYLLEDQ